MSDQKYQHVLKAIEEKGNYGIDQKGHLVFIITSDSGISWGFQVYSAEFQNLARHLAGSLGFDITEQDISYIGGYGIENCKAQGIRCTAHFYDEESEFRWSYGEGPTVFITFPEESNDN